MFVTAAHKYICSYRYRAALACRSLSIVNSWRGVSF